MEPGFADNQLLSGLFGDAEIAAHLDARAEIAAMVRFEAALAEVEARLGVIPAAAGPAIARALAAVDVAPPDLVAATTSAGVVVPGLVRALRSGIGAPYGDFLHWGATSQDAVDTGFVLRLCPILDLLGTRLGALVARLAELAETHAELPMAGRTRSQIATPTTFGLRVAGWMGPLARCLTRLDELRPRLLLVQFGGATGNLAVLGERGIPVMEALARALDLGCPAKPWHVERDAMVELANWLGMVSGLLGRIGADLILLGRSEIAEVTAGPGGGSSTMPQKANPVLAEALVTLARVAGSQVGLMQQALLHTEERDGATWAIEAQCLPAMLVATGAGLRHAIVLMEGLRPNPERMAESLASNGGAADAEAIAFALAERMPLSQAQDLVKAGAKAAGAQNRPLLQEIRTLCAAQGLDAPVLRPGAFGATARTLVLRATTEARRRE